MNLGQPWEEVVSYFLLIFTSIGVWDTKTMHSQQEKIEFKSSRTTVTLIKKFPMTKTAKTRQSKLLAGHG